MATLIGVGSGGYGFLSLTQTDQAKGGLETQHWDPVPLIFSRCCDRWTVTKSNISRNWANVKAV